MTKTVWKKRGMKAATRKGKQIKKSLHGEFKRQIENITEESQLYIEDCACKLHLTMVDECYLHRCGQVLEK